MAPVKSKLLFGLRLGGKVKQSIFYYPALLRITVVRNPASAPGPAPGPAPAPNLAGVRVRHLKFSLLTLKTVWVTA